MTKKAAMPIYGKNQKKKFVSRTSSRNDVPRAAQRYGTIAAHTWHLASILVVFVVFCMHMHIFSGLIRRTPPSTFNDTAVTDHHSDTTVFQLRAHWVCISWSVGSENRSDMCPWRESNPRLSAYKASTLSTRPGSPPKALGEWEGKFIQMSWVT